MYFQNKILKKCQGEGCENMKIQNANCQVCGWKRRKRPGMVYNRDCDVCGIRHAQRKTNTGKGAKYPFYLPNMPETKKNVAGTICETPSGLKIAQGLPVGPLIGLKDDDKEKAGQKRTKRRKRKPIKKRKPSRKRKASKKKDK